MILAVAATEFEMKPFAAGSAAGGCHRLVCGVGLVESTMRMAKFMERHGGEVDCVVNFGIAGVYPQDGKQQAGLLDICVAAAEVIGDLGIDFPLRIDELPGELGLRKRFDMDQELLSRVESILGKNGLVFHRGVFVTVNSASGTRGRGNMLRDRYGGLCENMEGAAIARVCEEFHVPMAEVRCISNYVEDRDTGRWQLPEASRRAGETAAKIVEELEEK